MYIGDAHINFEANIIDGRNGQQYVEPKIMRLLKFLADKPGTVFSREELITAVWGVDFGGDERLSRAISLLRKALGEEKGQRKYIETISRGGYRLIAEVSTAAPEVKTETKTEPESKRNPFQWIIAGLSGAVISALAAFFILSQSPASSSIEGLNVSEEMAAGFNDIQFWGHPGAIEDAQTRFTNILGTDPNNAAAHAGLALAYIREWNYTESDPALLNQARASALNALEQNEHLALSHIAMGWAAGYLKEPDRALQYLDRADVLDQDNSLTLEGRIYILGTSGDFEGAKRVTLKSIELYPENPNFRQFAVRLFQIENDTQNAEIHARQAVKFDPESPWVYSSLAQILHMQDKNTEAIQTIQSGLERHESAHLYNNLGTYLFFQGYYDLAASAFEKTINLEGNSHNPLFWANLGDAYRWIPGKKSLSSQNYDQALRRWEERLEADPDNLNLKSRIMLYRAKKKSGEKPESLIKEVIDTDDLQSVIYYRMLVTAELWGDRSQALNLLAKAANSGYPLNEIRNDPELKALRQDKAYHLIVPP